MTSGDLISRQAVLDGIRELKKSPWATDKRGYGFEYLIAEALDVVAELCVKQEPPVNPQKTQMIDKSNFDQEQYKADLQCAYDCGKASVNPQEPKTGHWISHREHCENLGVMPSGLGAYEWCSNCDCGIDVREWHRNHYNYCPNCGAKMVEPQESEE